MRKKGMIALVGAVLLLLLAGCWNSKDIQNMAYVTAIGCDYENGKYITYVQILNFSNVAKGEMSNVGKNIPAWIGRGEGVTVTESFNAIYSTSQIRTFWGHVKSIVMTERFLRKEDRVKEAYDMLNRYREVRYNILVYGTKEPLRTIFSQKSIMNLSPLDTVMDTPSQIYSQRSYILPLYSYKLVAQINQPPGLGILPSLSIDRGNWTEDQKPRTMFRIDGAYFFREKRLIGWLSEQDLEGYRWMQKKLARSPINIPNNDSPDASIILTKPKPHVSHEVRNGRVFFNVRLSLDAYVDEMVRNLNKSEIEEKSAREVERQLRATYEKALRIKADVYELSECLYRENPKKWHELQREGRFVLDKDSLDKIDVKVNLQHTGKYKGRVD